MTSTDSIIYSFIHSFMLYFHVILMFPLMNWAAELKEMKQNIQSLSGDKKVGYDKRQYLVLDIFQLNGSFHLLISFGHCLFQALRGVDLLVKTAAKLASK